MRLSTTLLGTLFCSTLMFSTVARADVAPPNLTQCNGKAVGTACTTDDAKAGTCQNAKCTKNDYSQGTPPKQVQYDCVQCTVGGASDGGGDATPSDGGTDANPPTGADIGPNSGPTKTDEGGCSLSPSHSAARASLALLISLLVVGVGLGRRNKRG